MTLTVGAKAPDFRLPSAQGPEVGLADYLGKKTTVLWFTKGMGCAFCRQQMVQIQRGYPAFAELGGEVLQISRTTLERARIYASKFEMPFPYLCDPDYRVAELYGLCRRQHNPAWYAASFLKAVAGPRPQEDPLRTAPQPAEIPVLLADDDMGFFVADREGAIRFALSGTYYETSGPVVRRVPSNAEIEAVLRDCR
ncbi:MAG: peroxiredoxin-like family protein [Candidatus Eremiobacterota bacterium]